MHSIREQSLENGMAVRFYDHTRRYFGDYFHVQLEVVCELPVCRENCPDEQIFEAAAALLGTSVTHHRTMERMGVPAEEVERTLAELVDKFNGNSLPYLASSAFPPKLLLAELDKAKRKTRRAYTP